MFFLIMSSLPELLAVAKDDIHVFVKGLELANEGTRVLEVELFSAKTMLNYAEFQTWRITLIL